MVVVAIAVVIVILLATRSPSPASGSGARNQSWGSATVQRRDLVQTDTESGTLGYANAQTVYNRLSGTITWLPVVGQVIKPGQPLYKVGNEPVILMNGATPAYRDLNPSDSAGPDILELNRNLVALGFDAGAIAIDDEWQSATAYGVELLQESFNETATGSLTLGRVVFLPGDQVISSVDARVGSDGGGSGTGNASAAFRSPAGGSSEFVSLTTTSGSGPGTARTHKPKLHRKPAKRSANAQTLAALTALLRAEIAQLKADQAKAASPNGSGPPSGSGSGSGNKGGNGNGNGGSGNGNGGSGNGNGGSSNANGGSGHGAGGSGGRGSANASGGTGDGTGSGSGGASASAILQTSSTQLVATVDLDATKQSEAKVGEQVTVELPNGSTVNGKVSAVSPVAQSSSGSGNGNGGGNGGSGSGNAPSSASIPVTITLSGHVPDAGLDQAAVSVNFEQQEASNVLSVPVTALLATAGGGYNVQAAAAPRALIPVTVGLFAAGYVQISGPGVYPGLAVTDSQG